MAYFVTARPDIGQAARQETTRASFKKKKPAVVYFLIATRAPPRISCASFYPYWGADESRAIPVMGDLDHPECWAFPKADHKTLNGNIRHFFLLAAVLLPEASAADQSQHIEAPSIRRLANAIHADAFEHVQLIAAAGLYRRVPRGPFRRAETSIIYFSRPQARFGSARAQDRRSPCGRLSARPCRRRQQNRLDGQIDGPYYFFS